MRQTATKRYGRFIARVTNDRTDEAIIELLTSDGRLSASEIGRRVGLSAAAAKRRIDRLEDLGIITGYVATVDYTKLGGQIQAFVEMRFDGATKVDEIDRTFSDVPEVVEAFTTAGDPDALARIRVNDLDHLKHVIDRIRRTGRVTGTKTLIVLGYV